MSTGIENDEIDAEFVLKRKLKEVNEFMDSWIYRAYISGIDLDIAIKRQEIVDFEPTDRPSEIESYKLRGELRVLPDFKTIFEEARDNLANKIDQIDIDKLNLDQQQSDPINET